MLCPQIVSWTYVATESRSYNALTTSSESIHLVTCCLGYILLCTPSSFKLTPVVVRPKNGKWSRINCNIYCRGCFYFILHEALHRTRTVFFNIFRVFAGWHGFYVQLLIFDVLRESLLVQAQMWQRPAASASVE